jgi:hypothetical protein
MTRMTVRLILIVSAVCVLSVIVISGVASGSAKSGPISLKAKGEFGKKRTTACHSNHRYRLFRGGRTIEFKGLLSPAPASHFAVKLEIKKCSRGQFRKFAALHTRGKRGTGKFKLFCRAPRSHRHHTTYYFGRAVINGQRSGKAYFAVVG